MRINSNKKVHKLKRDPYKTLLRVAGLLALVVVAGIGIFYLCSMAVTNDYVQKRNALDQQNAQAQVEFDTRMNALRNSQATTVDPDTGEVTPVELPYWESTLDDKPWRVQDEGTSGLENTSTVTLERSTLMLGGLMLVNAWHALPYDFSDTELISIGTTSGFKIQVQDNSVRVFPKAYDALNQAITDAATNGLQYYIVREAYRSNDVQSKLFTDKMNELSEKKNYTGNLLIEQTKKSVNYPGTSEYQTGMSYRLDLYSRDNADGVNDLRLQESEQGKWMTANCWKYGIIFRFPTVDFPTTAWEDKSYKTGVSTPMNLYRYVGKAHAAAMRIMDYCLEEYVEFLISHPHICIYEDGALRYEIVRINMGDGATFNLPVPNPASDYQASMDNMGGIVMAYTYN